MKKPPFFCNNKKTIKFSFLIILFFLNYLKAQTPLYSAIPVSDSGSNNNIGNANTSRNVAIDNNGVIYIVFANEHEIKLAKSINGGQSFSPSILVFAANNSEPEIAINNEGIVFIAWNDGGSLYISRSNDEGQTFSPPDLLSTNFGGAVHMSTFGSNVYLIDQNGTNVYSNNNYGIGVFNLVPSTLIMVYADVLTDQNGVLYVPMDNPDLFLFDSLDEGLSLNPVTLNPSGSVYYSSYALSDGPCGSYIFVGGGSIEQSGIGYKIDVNSGMTTQISLGENNVNFEGRTLYADNRGTLIDGYLANDGNLMINISTNQGSTFNNPIIVASGESHNIARSPTTDNISVVYEANGQIFLTVYNSLLKHVKITEPNEPLEICLGEGFDLEFTLNGVFDPNTQFSVLLSDEFGNFSNAIEIGYTTTNTSNVINCVIPSFLPSSSNYRLQILSYTDCLQSEIIPIIIGGAPIEGDLITCLGATVVLKNLNTPSAILPWTSSNTNVATIDDNGVVTTVNTGITEITFTSNGDCSISAEFKVLTEVVINQPSDLSICIDTNNDGLETFNLSSQNLIILNGLNPSQYNVTYHLSQEDADTNSDALNTTFTNSANPQIIFVRVEHKLLTNCFGTTSFKIGVNSTEANMPNDLIICDDVTNDGIAIFNLSLQNDTILNGQSSDDNLISYHFSQNDADLNINSLENSYSNISNPQQIFARVQNINPTDCYNTTTFNIVVNYYPIATTTSDLSVCDDDSNDGFEFFDLNTQNDTIFNGLDTSTNELTYHLTQEDANNNINTLSSQYQNTMNPQTIYARLQNSGHIDCFTTTSFKLIVNPKPKLTMNDQWFLCNGNSTFIIADDNFDSYLWSNGKTTRMINVTDPGIYSVTASNNYNGLICETVKDITVSNSSTAIITEITSNDFTLNQNIIEIFASGEGDYEYSIDGAIYQDSNIFRDLFVNDYTVFVRDKYGCGIAVEEVFLLFYPNFFTPNNDSFNDTWHLINANHEENNILYIFDRYGKLLTQLNPNSKGWDGTVNGNIMPSSDYWFLLKRQNGKTYKGHFTLKR